MTRQAVAFLYGVHFALLAQAYHWTDRDAFDRHSALVRQLLDNQELLLASHPNYRLDTLVSSLAGDPAQVAKALRQLYSVWSDLEHYGPLLDYCQHDCYELLRGYYRPRVEAFIEVLGGLLGSGRQPDFKQDLRPRYIEICRRWVEEGLVTERPEPPLLSPPEAVRRVIGWISSTPGVLPEIAIRQPKGQRVSWREDFDDMSRWYQTYEGGTMTCSNGRAVLESVQKWFLYGTDLDVDAQQAQFLAFRYRSRGGAAWIWVTWRDAAGEVRRNLVFDAGTSSDWCEEIVDLFGTLSLLGRPVRLLRIELNNQGPPHRSEWDWVKLSD